MSETDLQKNPNDSLEELPVIFELKNYPNSWYYGCWLIYLCYCFAAFVPTAPIWGIHFIAYIPIFWKTFLLTAGGLPLLPGIQRWLYSTISKSLRLLKNWQKARIIMPVIIAVICFILFNTFTIKTDIYGDNIRILQDYANNSKFDWRWIWNMFSPHLDLNKEALTVAIHRIVAHVFSISIGSSYQVMSEIFGALFILVWILFVQKISKAEDRSSVWPVRIVLILIGMFAGSVQIFFGHVENYSFGILTFTLFLAALYFYMEEKIGTFAFVLLYLLAFKAHIIAILFFPAFIVALAYHYSNALPKLQSLFTWRAIFRVVILPAFILGVIFYIFLFRDWNEPYSYVYAKARGLEQTFLPIVTTPAPLDHYSLFAPYHIADLFNLLLLTSAPIVVILASLTIFNRKEISWSQPRVIVFGLAALFPFLFFMALNPNLTPIRDWDVFTLLFPPLLFFTSILMHQKAVRPYLHALIAQSLIFGVIFTSVLVAVNASPNELQTRLQDAGEYNYHSYYASSQFIEAGALTMNSKSRFALNHFSDIVKDLSLTPNSGKDQELAEMMSHLASIYANENNNTSAIFWEENARDRDTSDELYIISLAGYNLRANKLAEASRTLDDFMKKRPDRDILLDVKLSDMIVRLVMSYARAGYDSLRIAWAEKAIPLFEQHLKLIPDDENALVAHAQLLHFADRDTEARESIRQLANRKDVFSLYHAARLQCAMQDYEPGLRTFLDAIIAGLRNIQVMNEFMNDDQDGVGKLKGTPEYDQAREIVEGMGKPGSR